MTAGEVLKRALDLLGYSPSSGNTGVSERIMNRAVALINTVYADLWGIENTAPFKGITNLTEVIGLEGRALECMPYGLAAFIAQSESDGDSQALWITLYNKKRAGLSKIYKKGGGL